MARHDRSRAATVHRAQLTIDVSFAFPVQVGGGLSLALHALVECLIEVVEGSDHLLVRLAGRLAEQQVPDLMGVCSTSTKALRVHLGNLISVDAVGLEALHRLRQGGATMIEAPGYIQLKLDAFSAKRAPRPR